jgi:hypothetical protein
MSYTIVVPDHLYHQAQKIAIESAQDVEEVIRTHLNDAMNAPFSNLPVSERDELTVMAYLSDDALWTIAREILPLSVRERMSVLMTKNTKGSLSNTEHAELADLVERGNRLTLRKAQAMKYLTQRGYKITVEQ